MIGDEKFRGALWVLETLESAGFAARMAGGCVRDRCMGVSPQDYDIATNANPHEVTALFYSKKAKVIPTGIEHGTVTVIYRRNSYEITTLRHDVETFGRHARVEFGSSFEEDAARRDFTINAMFEDRHGQLYDFFGGLDDLKLRLLRFVGDPRTRIREDYLRILRFFRFWSRFEFATEETALATIREECTGLSLMSKERITAEMTRILEADRPLVSLQGMKTLGVFEVLFSVSPTLDTVVIGECFAFKKELRMPFRLVSMFAAELKGDDGEKFLTEALRFSNLQKNRILELARLPHYLKKSVSLTRADRMEILDHYDALWGTEELRSSFLPATLTLYPELSTALLELIQIESDHGTLRKKIPPVRALVVSEKMGIAPGPFLGVILGELKKQFRNGLWSQEEEALVLAEKLHGLSIQSKKPAISRGSNEEE